MAVFVVVWPRQHILIPIQCDTFVGCARHGFMALWLAVGPLIAVALPGARLASYACADGVLRALPTVLAGGPGSKPDARADPWVANG